MALADVYDALISERVYKPAFAHEKVRNIIVEGRGGGLTSIRM
jgi:HD-GYP domain-containing protein (c-di-GMP phosphodiesterase class II)